MQPAIHPNAEVSRWWNDEEWALDAAAVDAAEELLEQHSEEAFPVVASEVVAVALGTVVADTVVVVAAADIVADTAAVAAAVRLAVVEDCTAAAAAAAAVAAVGKAAFVPNRECPDC